MTLQRILLLCCLCLLTLPAVAATPTWGAARSSPVDTPSTQLRPGDWIWGGDDPALGPMVVVVSLDEQRAYVYRNGLQIAVSTVSSGKPGHETPTGVFTILQKDRDHHSSKYNNAAMPYQERLTWDGVALHAGGLPGYPESHGCVHLPTEFARRLFSATTLGMTVVVAQGGHATAASAHPGLLSPVDPASGATVAVLPLDDGQPWRWTGDAAATGPVSLVLSRSDQRLIALEDGREVGRARITLPPATALRGTHVYVMGDGAMPVHVDGVPDGRMPQWQAIAVPGRDDDAGQPLDPALLAGVRVPAAFVDALLPRLRPGTVLVATDAHVMPETTGRSQRVLDALPPGG
ncbi:MULTISPECIES: L,D-transpeptidase [Luteimonas]|uniref:L,D-transpeptidase n=1 Tax=Luteimonas TaxID=83614 RepID=UPI000C7D7553|nr:MULTISPECIES: L,D-transpeptidase [Luteimonas]